MHIPRTGGGSVKSGISLAYGRPKSVGDVQLGADKSQKILQRIAGSLDAWSGRAVAGHVPYGLYARYLPADTRYVTFLREPVERVLSQYYADAQAGPDELRASWRRDPALAGADVGDEDDISLEAGLARGITIYNNLATRFLSGESLEGELPPDALDRASGNLARFAFVGVTERLDEGMILLARMLGVQPAGYQLRRVRAGRPTVGDVSAALRRLIEKHNALDVELYRAARERFDAEAAAAGDVSAEIEELRQRQIEVTEQVEAERVSRKTGRRAERHAARQQRADEVDEIAAMGIDALREELVALKRRLETIEGALGTMGDGSEAGDGARAGRKRTARRARTDGGERPGKPRKRDRDGTADASA